MKNQNKSLIILMADDDPDDRLLVKDALAECDPAQQIQFAENGEDLLNYLEHRDRHQDASAAPRPGLILLDLNMPLKDGREALRDIKSHPHLRRIPVVIFTTSNADTDIRQTYDLGANSFVTKPTRFASLVEVMRSLCGYWSGVVTLPV